MPLTRKQPDFSTLFPARAKRWARRVAVAVAGTLGLFLLLNVLFPLRVNISYSPVIYAADGSILHSFLSPDEKWRMQLAPDEISPVLQRAVLLKEDRYFYYHPGVNPVAVGRALLKNLAQGKTTSGASTITMQVARLLYPNERTYWHKLTEVFRALQLEARYSKTEILQLYLNLVPYGGNIEGVKAASVLYFQQSPKELSLAQAVALTVIPNKPSSLRIGLQNPRIVAFRNKWLRYYQRQEAFPRQAIADALLEPLNAQRLAPPRMAPHFAYRMFRQHPGQASVRTTLQPRVQEKVEQLAYNYLQQLNYKNIHNAAVLVLNNQTGAVEAYLGSADFTDVLHGGQVDGVRALRSPGSTLKPFLYAVAFEKGLITPKTIITDVPVDYAGYRPENYFGTYSGNITIERALATSLNIPAVKLLDQVGVAPFVQKLEQAGFSQMKKKGDQLGLSLILGGCGVTLEELTTLYAAFARQGKHAPTRWLQQDTSRQEKQLLSTGATFMVNQILTQLQRPDLPHNAQNSAHLPKIAWKTGTSYGRKDAWSIGYNQKYTVGVWVGNFSGEGVPELNGTDTATPLLFSIFNTLDYNSPNHWYKAPATLGTRRVCLHSGLPANSFCQDLVVDTYLPGISRTTKCTHLKKVAVSVDGKYAYCPHCLPQGDYQEKWYPNHPPELLTYFVQQHLPYVALPPHHPGCSRIFQEWAPVIASPTAGMEYLLEKADQQKLMLQCHAHNEVKKVYWYVNDRFLQAAPRDEPVFFAPEQAGKLKISCLDDQGRNTNSYVTVRLVE
ncbi:penicillin-binding protein 1C [Rufibacter psychrotolerans]|uniref:penicillin-binding protein 1C n=1 Tax=Rufibacter psychrotolerans TaxID=2812556 RepID=UPI00196898B6|nr:penicillin-binding protein 1C [Rufibacter sp. SYSU D00308]